MPHAHQGSVDVVVDSMNRDEALFECIAYKATRLSEIVCQRTVTLFKDRFTTTHQDLSGGKCWYLDRSCRLEPEYVEEIISPERRSIRPPGTWTVTAKLGTVTGSGQPIELYCVTIHWPTSWLATRGYTSFTLGFETAQAAAQWHARVQQQISLLRLRTNSLKGDTSIRHSPQTSYDDSRSFACSGGGPIVRKPSQDKGFIASALEHWLGSKDDKASVGDEAGIQQTQGMQYRMPTSPVQIPIPSRSNSTSNMQYPQEMPDEGAVAGTRAGKAYGPDVSDLDRSDSQSSSLTDQPLANPDEQRWVPYRHSNGVAIYHHKESKCLVVGGGGDTAEEPGSEYMASSIVRGSPDECLAVLMDMSSNTTILGPASKIELLTEADERQVLRFSVEATGMARHLCAPREIIVERVSKREECGVDVVLFSSCDPLLSTPLVRTRTRRSESQPSLTCGPTAASNCRRTSSSSGRLQSKLPVAGLSVVAAAAAMAVAATQSAAAAVLTVFLLGLVIAAVCLLGGPARPSAIRSGSGGVSSSSKRSSSPTSSSIQLTSKTWSEWLQCAAVVDSLTWYKPVRAFVQGGYTISPREDCIGANSPECLVTCILKVDLGGYLGERSWLRPLAAALGWVDAYVERMLMAVILVKDEVEQRRFLVQPFSMLTNTARSSADNLYDDAASDSSSAVDVQPGQQAKVLRRQSSRRRQQQSMQSREPSLRWQVAGAGERQAKGSYRVPYSQEDSGGFAAQRQTSAGLLGRSALTGSAADLARQSSRKQQSVQQKQKGRLGRMASKIYALRPRVLRGSDRPQPTVFGLQPSGQLGSDSIAFNNQIAADSVQPSSPAADAQYPTPFGAVDTPVSVSAAMDLSDPKQLLAGLGMPADTVVVDPSYYAGGPQGPAAADSTLNEKCWSELHTPGTPAPFKLRGATYLEDHNKIEGGTPQFVLGSVDLVETPGPVQHISRFLPAVRGNQAAYSFVVNLIIPGTPVLSLVAVFINEHHPDILEGAPGSTSSSGGQPELSRTSGASTSSSGMMHGPRQTTGRSRTVSATAVDGSTVTDDSRQASRGVSSCDDCTAGASGSEGDCRMRDVAYQRPSDTSDWQPFDYCLHRFLHAGDETRTSMFKLIPHIAEGSWVIKQSVGTVPVILGNKLKTVYYQTDRYVEACVDVTSSSAAAYITGMVRGATKSLVIDLGFVLEGQRAEELPEALLGAFRLNHLDCTSAQKIDTSKELPLLPRPLQHHQLVALQQQQQGLLTTVAGSGGIRVVGSDAVISTGSAAGLSWQSSELPSNNGVAPAADVQQQTGNRAGQQQGSVQQMQQLHNLAAQLQQRCRNSIGVIETGRTMTGHARSRSAASVEELISASNSPRAQIASSKLQPRLPALAHSNSASQALSGSTQHQRSGSRESTSAAAGAAAPRQATGGISSSNSILHDRAAPAAVAAGGTQGLPCAPTATSTAAPNPVEGNNASFLANATPVKQLLSSFANLTGAERGSGAKGSTSISCDADARHTGSPRRAGNNNPASGAHQVLGAVNSPSMCPATAGGVGSGASRGHPAAGTTPAAGSSQRNHHHRSSSNSEGDSSSKMSAAAYISRAHASALAASAQRRTQQHQGHKTSQQLPPAASVEGISPALSHHGALTDDAELVQGGATAAYVSLPPASGGPADARAPAAEASGMLLHKRPRTSSSGATAMRTQDRNRDGHREGSRDDLLQQQGQYGVDEDARVADPAAPLGGNSRGHGSGVGRGVGGHNAGHKISASEQLRLAQQTMRVASTSGGPPGHHHSTSSSSSLLGAGAGDKQVTGDAHASLAVSEGTAPPLVKLQSQQLKQRISHRRFASMGAVQ